MIWAAPRGAKQGISCGGENIKRLFAERGITAEGSRPEEVIRSIQEKLGATRGFELAGGEGELTELKNIIAKFADQEARATAPFEAMQTENQRFVEGLNKLLGTGSPLITALENLTKGNALGTQDITASVTSKFAGKNLAPQPIGSRSVIGGEATGFVPSFSPDTSAVARAVKTEKALGGKPVLDYHHSIGSYVRDGRTQKNFADVRRTHGEGMENALINSRYAQAALGHSRGFVPNFIKVGFDEEHYIKEIRAYLQGWSI